MDKPVSDNCQHTASLWRSWHSIILLTLLVALLIFRLMLPTTPRLWTWLSILMVLSVFALVVGHEATGVWLGVLIDSRNKVSLSRLQMLVWTVVILSAYLTAVLVNLDLEHTTPLAVSIPPELWLLMGITTTSLVGSPLLLNVKKQQQVDDEKKSHVLSQLAQQAMDTSKMLIQGSVVINITPKTARWSDLFRGSQTSDAGQVDLGKLQMFFFTLVVLLAYSGALAALFGRDAGVIHSLPAPDTGTLMLLGISHAGYLVSKAGLYEGRRM